ncbi:hypothetical protein [Modestobacter sp. URMC 112]
MSSTPDEEFDDPGRDPKGLAVPRNPLAGADQDSGQGEPEGSPSIEGQSMVPEAPGEDDRHA